MSLELRILRYLKENPGATPRLIADALGVPVSQVRQALNRLRDSGQVVRIPGEGYYARAVGTIPDLVETPETEQRRHEEDLRSRPTFEELREVVYTLASRVERLEKDMKEIRIAIEALTKAIQESKSRSSSEQEPHVDRLIRDIRAKKLMKVNEALILATKPVEEYVKAGIIRVVSDLVVDAEFYEKFLNKFPIKRLDIPRLSDEEQTLISAMIKEGIVYLHGGREYRVSRG